jgi:regulator of sirC expression with transglutaminase-like and TPR domain
MGMGEIEGKAPSRRLIVINKQWQHLLELCHFTEELNPIWEAKLLQARFKKLSEPIISRVKPLNDEEEKFKKICDYFYSELQFSICDKNKISLQSCFLPHVLTTKNGPPSVLMLFLCALLEECNIKAQVSSSRVKYLLKVQLNNKSHIIDFAQKGHFLKPYEIVDLINRGFDFSQGCFDSNMLIVEYLNLVKKYSRKENKLHILSLVHSYLMRYQPFNLKHISERAMVAFETGDYRTAIDDIRSYFQYKQSGLTNENLKRIYKMALKKNRQTNDQSY